MPITYILPVLSFRTGKMSVIGINKLSLIGIVYLVCFALSFTQFLFLTLAFTLSFSFSFSSSVFHSFLFSCWVESPNAR